MVKLLVTGAAGGLGRAVCRRAAGTFEITALDRKGLDVSKLNEVLACVEALRPDVIFDAAGFTRIDACEEHVWDAFRANAAGAEHLARAASRTGALLVYPGSDLIFDGRQSSPYLEHDAPEPLSNYGDSKLAGELAVLRHAPRHLILRTGWLFGPDGRSYVSELLEWRQKEEIVFGFDDHLCQPTFQDDYVDAALALFTRGATGVWNVAAAGQATHADVARETLRLLGDSAIEVRPLQGTTGARPALRPRYSVLDGTKLASAGISMRPWPEALAAFLASVKVSASQKP